MPEFIKGVINLRGNVIPIISVRKRFKMEDIPFNERTCIIVVTINETSVGLIVDSVSEVLDIPADKVGPAPKAGNVQNRYIQGIGKIGESVKIILCLDKMLPEEEMAVLSEIA
jgi:purine-binding chemotaxis protein CheW